MCTQQICGNTAVVSRARRWQLHMSISEKQDVEIMRHGSAAGVRAEDGERLPSATLGCRWHYGGITFWPSLDKNGSDRGNLWLRGAS